MEVNLGLAVGQKWRTRRGVAVTIDAHEATDTSTPFHADNGNWYGANGVVWNNKTWASTSDLVERIVEPQEAAANDSHEALTFAPLPEPEPEVAAVEESFQAFDAQVKLSNPKDAVGDTKLPLWLLSPIAKAHWALGQFAGMLKYGAWNWRAAGVRASVYISALERHMEGYKNGETFDPVDGTHHLGNIMACCGILLEAEAIGKLTDDRPPSIEMRKTFEQVQAQMAVLREQYKDKAPKHWTIHDEVPA